MKRIKQVVRLSLALVALGTPSAHAYIDPGSGSYILQILVAGALGALFSLKLFWHRILALFRGFRTRSKTGKQTLP